MTYRRPSDAALSERVRMIEKDAEGYYRRNPRVKPGFTEIRKRLSSEQAKVRNAQN